MDRGKRKISTKQQVRRGRGRGSSSGVFFGDDRAARQQYIQQEEMLQQQAGKLWRKLERWIPMLTAR